MHLESGFEDKHAGVSSASDVLMEAVNWCRKHETQLVVGALAIGALCVTRGKFGSAAVAGQAEKLAVTETISAGTAIAGTERIAGAAIAGSERLAGAAVAKTELASAAALSNTERLSGAAAVDIFAETSINRVPTPGALIRRFSPADQQVCDRVARSTGMGHFSPGWDNWVLETPRHGVVGYTSTFNRCWSDVAVLPQFRGDTRLLTDTVLAHMRAEGGQWFANAKRLTGYPYLKRLEKDGLIRVVKETELPYAGRDGLSHSVEFLVP